LKKIFFKYLKIILESTEASKIAFQFNGITNEILYTMYASAYKNIIHAMVKIDPNNEKLKTGLKLFEKHFNFFYDSRSNLKDQLYFLYTKKLNIKNIENINMQNMLRYNIKNDNVFYNFSKEILKSTKSIIENDTHTKLKNNFNEIESGSWHHFSSKKKFKGKNKFYITLDLWEIKENEKTIYLDKQKIKTFNELLNELADNSTIYTFSFKMHISIDILLQEIDNLVIHYSQDSENNTIINFFNNLKSKYKEIINNRDQNESMAIKLDDGEKIYIKRSDFGVDVDDPEDQNKQFSDTALKTKIGAYWLKLIIMSFYKAINNHNFQQPSDSMEDFFANDFITKTIGKIDETQKQKFSTEIKPITESLKEIYLEIYKDIYNNINKDPIIKKIKEGLNINDLNDSKINNKHYTEISKTIIIFSNLVTDTINNIKK